MSGVMRSVRIGPVKRLGFPIGLCTGGITLSQPSTYGSRPSGRVAHPRSCVAQSTSSPNFPKPPARTRASY
ncbi:hypothetical protein ACVWWO_005287 [Bradyrhizobium sp. F1.13.1]